VSATRATRTSSSVSLLIYLYRNSFCRPHPIPFFPSRFFNPETSQSSGPRPFSFFLLAGILFWCGLLSRGYGLQTSGRRALLRLQVKDDINIIAI